MKILDTVIGSNHLLIQPHTVGKNEGAPMICGTSQMTHKQLNPLWAMSTVALADVWKLDVDTSVTEPVKGNSLRICDPASLGNAP